MLIREDRQHHPQQAIVCAWLSTQVVTSRCMPTILVGPVAHTSCQLGPRELEKDLPIWKWIFHPSVDTGLIPAQPFAHLSVLRQPHHSPPRRRWTLRMSPRLRHPYRERTSRCTLVKSAWGRREEGVHESTCNSMAARVRSCKFVDVYLISEWETDIWS